MIDGLYILGKNLMQEKQMISKEIKARLIEKGQRFFAGDNISDCLEPVSYTHLTLPTNREV